MFQGFEPAYAQLPRATASPPIQRGSAKRRHYTLTQSEELAHFGEGPKDTRGIAHRQGNTRPAERHTRNSHKGTRGKGRKGAKGRKGKRGQRRGQGKKQKSARPSEATLKLRHRISEVTIFTAQRLDHT